MLSMLSFILVVTGCLNWLSIGLLQFDFVAGLFGTQANIFSRIVYIIIGAAMIYTTYLAIRYKGKVIRNFSLKSLMFWKKKKNKSESENSEVSARNLATEHGRDISSTHREHMIDDKNSRVDDKKSCDCDKKCNCNESNKNNDNAQNQK